MNFLFYKDRAKIIHIFILIIAILAFRLPVFFLSHNNNDELIHLSLAMKIDRYGLDVFREQQYNLFYVEKGIIPQFHLMGVFKGEDRVGSLLKGFLGEQEKLSHHPPALPFLIAISHKIFAHRLGYFVNISSNLDLMFRNAVYQFYACFIPFLFSILLILSVYILGSLFFSHRVGILSALFLSLTPAELMAANKIWADDMTAFFVVLSIVFYLYALKISKPLFSLFSGFCCGLSILTKMSGIYIIFVVLLFHLFEHRGKSVNSKNLKKFIFNKNILYFLAGAFMVSAWWFDLYYSYFNIHGTKSYFKISDPWVNTLNWNRYFNITYSRPWYSYFILIPFQFPLYLLSYIFIPIFIFRRQIKTVSGLIGKEYRYLQFLIIWMVVVFMFLTLKPGKELRYMLIVYPAISVLSIYCLNLSYEWLKNKVLSISPHLLRLFFISVILVISIYSLKIALPRVIFRADVIPLPL